MKAIGIDLGTTNSCIGIWNRDTHRVDIVANEHGNRTTPSVVAFTNDERLVGEDALRQQNRNPRNTIYEIKRFIGRTFNDPAVQSDVAQYCYVICDPTGENRPQVYYKFRGEDCIAYPEEISSHILQKLKHTASEFAGEEVTNAVITVPAYFNDGQRQATKDAGEIAGIRVLRVLNEPTAAAIAYGLDQKYSNRESDANILVFDLGGGTFDVSLLTLGTDGIFEVRAISGDTRLGGSDFDQVLMRKIIEDFESKYKLRIPRDNFKALQKIRSAAEKAKCCLSSSKRAYIDIDSLHDGIDFSMVLTRAEFEELASDLFDRCITPVKQVLHDAHMEPEQIHDIVLVGGSTRIPKLQEMLSTFFNGKELCKSINPDEAVAHGAAIQASILSQTAETFDENLPDYVLLDVAPLSLGIETSGGLMTTLIKRNATIPITKSKVFSTAEDEQDTVTIQVYEGERTETCHNRLLGTFDLSGIEPAPRGTAQIEVTFELDADGIFTVSADDITKGAGKGVAQTLKIEDNKGRLSPDEIASIIERASGFEEDDRRFKDIVSHRNDLLNIVYAIRNLYESDDGVREFATPDELQLLRETFTAEKEWLDQNDVHSIRDVSVYQEKMNYLQRELVNEIVEHVNERIREKRLREKRLREKRLREKL